PDLHCNEADNKAENDPKRREHAWRERFEGAGPIIDGKADHREMNGRSDEIGGCEDNHRHPCQGQVQEPITHGADVHCSKSYCTRGVAPVNRWPGNDPCSRCETSATGTRVSCPQGMDTIAECLMVGKTANEA